MTGGNRLAARLLVTTALMGWVYGSALAQTTPGDIVDPDLIVDENGVDLLTGKYYAVTARAASGDLAYTAKWLGAEDASLLNSRIVASANDVFVSISGKTTKFTKVGSTYVPVGDKGATLTKLPTDWIYTEKSGNKAIFYNDPANLAGNAAGITSAHLTSLTFSDPTRKQLNYIHQTVSSGGLVYRRVSQIMETYFGGGEGYNVINLSYASQVATHPSFKTITSVKAWYQGAPMHQQACWDTACSNVIAKEQLTIDTTSASGVETISMSDKGGGVTVVRKGANGVTAIRNPGDASDGIALTYNGSGEVATLTDYGRAFTYTFGASGTNRTATVTLAGGGSKYYVVDPTRRILLSMRNEELETQSFAYDTEGRVTQVTYPEGNALTYDYDARSNMTQTSRVAKPGSGEAITALTLGFPATCVSAATCNQAIWSKDAKGAQTDYINGLVEDQYYIDEVRFPAATLNGDRLVVRKKYSQIFGRAQDEAGFEEPTAVVSTELTTVEKYNAVLGNFLAKSWVSDTNFFFDDNFGKHEILPIHSGTKGSNGSGGILIGNGSTIASYDAFGRLEARQSNGFGYNSDRYFHDANNRQTGIIRQDHDGTGPMLFSATRRTYNGRGLVEKVETGTATAQTEAALNAMTVLRATENTYDANRRLERSQVRVGGAIVAVTQYSYNAQGLVECMAQRMNPAIFAGLPASACTLGAQGSFGPDRISKNHYDLTGRLLRSESAFGTVEVGDESVLTYHDNGTVATMTDGQGNRTSFEYDGHDRLKKKIFPHKTSSGTSDPADYEQYWYDANDNLTQKRLRDGQSIYFSYDRLNRMTLVDLPGAESDIGYTYDIEGRLKTATRGSISTAISYDGLGRMVSEGNNIGAVQYQYDSVNRLTRMTWPDGFYVTYDYHGAGPIKSIKENGTAAIATYGYDSFGRRISVTYGSGAAQTYGYDAAARLGTIGHNLAGTANDQTISLTYNPASQIATRTASNDAHAFTGHFNVDRPYVANGLNQFTTAGAVSFGYDARGNLTSSGANSYGYTSDNLLTSGPGSATLSYDGRGTLFETAKSGVTTRFLYAGSALVGEYSGSNILQRRYIHGPGTDNPLLWYEGTGTTNKRYLMGDERGSITTLSDGTGGLFGINSYDEYGIPGSGNSGRFQYTGQAWLPELGMYHYKARIYSPTLGRFMQTDPIGYGDGLNIYNYVGSDPVNGVDPTGMVGIVDPNDIVVSGELPVAQQKEPSNCLSFGGSCVSTGRDIADEYAYAYAQQQERLKAPPAAAGCAAPGPRHILNRAIKEADARRQSDLQKINDATKQFGTKEAYPIVIGIQVQTMNWYVSKVRTGGDWDFKNQPETRGNQDFGNFAFGATAEALGYSDFGHVGADLYSLWENHSFENQDSKINMGQEYYRNGCQGKK